MKRVGFAVAAAAIVVVVAIWWTHGRDAEPTAAKPTTSEKPAAGSTAPPSERAGEVQLSLPPLDDDDPVGTLRLEGLVLGTDDKPVAGAVVGLGSTPPRNVTTEADGTFTFDGLVARTYRVVAHAKQGVAGPVVATLTATSEPLVLHLRAGARLVVSIVGTDGKPVDDANVELRGIDTQAIRAEHGEAVFAPIVPGPYRLAASATGRAPAFQIVRVTGETRARIVLQAGAPVSGRVVDDGGKPVANAHVIYAPNGQWAAMPDPRLDAVVTGGDGGWRFPALPPGSLRFYASDQDHAPGTSALVVLDGKTEKSGIDITLGAGAMVHGKVVDTTKQPVPGARVMISAAPQRGGGNGRRNARPPGGGGGPAAMGTGQRQAYTDAQGEFTVRGLPRDALLAIAQHEKGGSTPIEVDASAGNPPEITIVLDLTAFISGVVVDDTGEPIEGAQVMATVDRRNGFDPAQLGRGSSTAISDAGGRFRVTGLPDGDYTLHASRSAVRFGGGRGRRGGGDGVAAHTGDDKVKIVLLAEGGVTAKVAFTDGSAPALVAASVGPVQQSFVGGVVTLDGIPPGDYRLTVSGPGFDAHEQDVTVPAGKAVDLGTILVASGRKIAGVVVSNNQPVVGATVYAGTQVIGGGATNEAPGQQQLGGQAGTKTDTTDASGSFALAGLPDGNLTVIADLPGVGRSKARMVTEDEQDQTALQLELMPYGSISGSMQQGGAPAANVNVTAQSSTVPGAVYAVRTGVDGAYRFDQLAPDTYKVSAMLGTPRRGMHMYSQPVTVAPGVEAHVDLTVDPGAVVLTATAHPSAGTAGVVVAYLAGASLTGPMASDVSIQLAGAGAGASQVTVAHGSEPATFTDVQAPGADSVCLIPLPPDLSGRSAQGYLQAHATKLQAFCKPVTVAASPAQQTIDIPVTLPPPAGNGSGSGS